MENIVDYDELATNLSQNNGTKKMWVSILSLVGIIAVTYLTGTVHYDSTRFTGVFGTGWTFDYNNYLFMLLGSIASVVVLGLKIQGGLQKVVQKQAIIATKDKEIGDLVKLINEKDTEIAIVKTQLDDATKTLEANQRALAVAQSKLQ